jgi:hypothetical protein
MSLKLLWPAVFKSWRDTFDELPAQHRFEPFDYGLLCGTGDSRQVIVRCSENSVYERTTFAADRIYDSDDPELNSQPTHGGFACAYYFDVKYLPKDNIRFLVERMKSHQRAVELEILRTPSGAARNRLTEQNIGLTIAIDNFIQYLYD